MAYFHQDETGDAATALAIAALKPRLTSEFLGTLTEAARTFGWSGDYIEVVKFVEAVYGWVGIPLPDIEPYHFYE